MDAIDKLGGQSTDDGNGVEPLPLVSGEGNFEDMDARMNQKTRKKKSKS